MARTGRSLPCRPLIRRPFVGTQIAFDATSNSGYQTTGTTLSWTHLCSGANRFLSVDVALLALAGTTVSSITYNGVSMTVIGTQASGSGAVRTESWGLINPAGGSNTILVTFSGSIVSGASAGTAVSYTGVHQSLATEAWNGATATNIGAADALVTVTPVADKDWIHAGVATDDTAITANQTIRNNVTGVLGSGADEDTGPITPASGQSVGFTAVGAAATWSIGGYGIRPTTASAAISRNFGFFIE